MDLIWKFVKALPGKIVDAYYGAPDFSIQGARFKVVAAELDTENQMLTIEPAGQNPWSIEYHTLTLLTEDRLVAQGEESTLRLEVRLDTSMQSSGKPLPIFPNFVH